MADIPTHKAVSTVPRQQTGRAYGGRPDRKADNRFYASKVWRLLRALVLRQEPLCRACRADGRVTPASHVDHVIDRKDRPDLALDRDNLQALCPACHNRKRGARPAAPADACIHREGGGAELGTRDG